MTTIHNFEIFGSIKRERTPKTSPRSNDSNNNYISSDNDEKNNIDIPEMKILINETDIELWKNILSKWDTMESNERRKMGYSLVVRNPIPSSIRKEAWLIISGANKIMKQNTGNYKLLYNTNSNSDSIQLIKKDINRTFGSKYSTVDLSSNLEKSLYRVLVAYSNYDTEVGYCQGMNYVAGFLILLFKNENNDSISEINEEKCFWLFTTLLDDNKYYIRSLYTKDMIGYKECESVYLNLCKEHIPLLYNHLSELKCTKLFLSPWLHSLFSKYPNVIKNNTSNYGTNLIYYLWDLYLLSDITIFIKLAVVTCLEHTKELLNLEFIELVNFLKDGNFLNYKLIKFSLKVKLNKTIFRSLFNLHNLYHSNNINMKNIKFKHECNGNI